MSMNNRDLDEDLRPLIEATEERLHRESRKEYQKFETLYMNAPVAAEPAARPRYGESILQKKLKEQTDYLRKWVIGEMIAKMSHPQAAISSPAVPTKPIEPPQSVEDEFFRRSNGDQ